MISFILFTHIIEYICVWFVLNVDVVVYSLSSLCSAGGGAAAAAPQSNPPGRSSGAGL